MTSATCYGATLGIIGEGAIGQARRRIGRAFGMRVLFADHPPPKMEGVTLRRMSRCSPSPT